MDVNGVDPLGLGSLRDSLSDGKLSVGEILDIELTPEEIKAIISSCDIVKKDGTEEDLFRRSKEILFLRNKSIQSYTTEMYETARAFNPVHYVAEKSYALGSGSEPVLGNKIDRKWTAAELGLYLITLYGGDKGMGKLKSYCLEPASTEAAALTGEAAEEVAIQSKSYWVSEELGNSVLATPGANSIITAPNAGVSAPPLTSSFTAGSVDSALSSTIDTATVNTTTDIVSWPPNNGFLLPPDREFLMPGTLIDRYGYQNGRFTAPVGTPIPSRALRPGTVEKGYHMFEVLKPFEVNSGLSTPWYGKPGMGIQYQHPPVDVLLKHGIIEKVGP